MRSDSQPFKGITTVVAVTASAAQLLMQEIFPS
jgi:hypothetical protein